MPVRPLHSLRTLVFLHAGDDVLLLRRRADKAVLPGYYNGVGGHVEAGEDVVSSARREAREETGLQVDGLRLKGLLHIPAEADAANPSGVVVAVFTAEVESAARGRSRWTCDEGELEWVPRAEALERSLVPDVRAYWPALWDEAPAPFIAHLSPLNGVVLHYWAMP